MKTAVIIPAAGTGSRMGVDKQLMPLKGKPVLTYTLAAFDSHDEVDEIIVVAPRNVADVILPYGFEKVKTVVEGGDNRQASVWAGIQQINSDVTNVLIHDGARPLVTHNAISDVLACVRRGIPAISGVKPKDTIKLADNCNMVKETPNRDKVWIVQTPQGFPAATIIKAHELAITENFLGTDDAMLVERMGVEIYMVEGDYHNIKLTTPEDRAVAEALLSLTS